MQTIGDSSFASDCYLHVKALWRGQAVRRSTGRRGSEVVGSAPFGGHRDPQPLGDVLMGTASDLGWKTELDRARLISEWPSFIGESVAEHTRVVELREQTLIVQCDSTAWATELRRLRGEVLTRLIDEYPGANIRELKFLAPGAPSWRHGLRTVPGRGPRDTYG